MRQPLAVTGFRLIMKPMETRSGVELLFFLENTVCWLIPPKCEQLIRMDAWMPPRRTPQARLPEGGPKTLQRDYTVARKSM